jgi:hypothetical protein
MIEAPHYRTSSKNKNEEKKEREVLAHPSVLDTVSLMVYVPFWL